MKEHRNLWWPDFEHNPEELFKYMLRRVTDVDVAMQHVRTKGVAVQAGGYIGLWPRRLAKFFELVYTFEPVPELFECLKLNTDRYCPGVIATNALLGPSSGTAQYVMKSGGRTTAINGGDRHAGQYCIDELDLVRCDAIYLDVERYELEVLKGAEETIRKFKPVVTLEVKEDTQQEFTDFMRARGYSLAAKVHADAVYVPIAK
jgi:FkbM family methyltransferase